MIYGQIHHADPLNFCMRLYRHLVDGEGIRYSTYRLKLPLKKNSIMCHTFKQICVYPTGYAHCLVVPVFKSIHSLCVDLFNVLIKNDGFSLSYRQLDCSDYTIIYRQLSPSLVGLVKGTTCFTHINF